MNSLKTCLFLAFTVSTLLGPVSADESDPLTPWRAGVKIQPVSPQADRHVIHAYFNTCPESPDGKYVLYYTSTTPEGEAGDLRILERGSGQETIIATDLHTEDAHRAACQQWSNGGRTVIYHDNRAGHWQVVAIDVATGKSRVLAMDRQVAFGSATGQWAPVYGCHWNPGPNRNLELVNVVTGEVRVAVKAADVVKEYGDWMQKKLGSTDMTIFFPVMSHDEKKVFFKVAIPSGGNDFHSMAASKRDGKVVYDLEAGRFVRLLDKWGHPSWTPDDKAIFEYGNYSTDIVTGKTERFAPSCVSDHPSVSLDGRLFVTDADVTKRYWGNPGDWTVAVVSMQKDDWVVLQIFGNSKGAKSWRHNHPHPTFSADGQRIYYNVNSGPWTTLMVAQSAAARTDSLPSKTTSNP
jgi:Tol biopolymer transport system component